MSNPTADSFITLDADALVTATGGAGISGAAGSIGINGQATSGPGIAGRAGIGTGASGSTEDEKRAIPKPRLL